MSLESYFLFCYKQLIKGIAAVTLAVLFVNGLKRGVQWHPPKLLYEAAEWILYCPWLIIFIRKQRANT